MPALPLATFSRLRCLLLLIPLSIALIGCAARSQPIASPATAPTTRSTFASSDADVLRAVLHDLLNARGQENPIAIGDEPPPSLLFSMSPIDSPAAVVNVLDRDTQWEWTGLLPSERRLAAHAAANLLARMQAGDLFSPFDPGDSRITLKQTAAVTQPNADVSAFLHQLHHRPLAAASPGYSPTGRIAVVVIAFPWSMHAGLATYILKNDDGTWQILSKTCVFYV